MQSQFDSLWTKSLFVDPNHLPESLWSDSDWNQPCVKETSKSLSGTGETTGYQPGSPVWLKRSMKVYQTWTACPATSNRMRQVTTETITLSVVMTIETETVEIFMLLRHRPGMCVCTDFDGQVLSLVQLFCRMSLLFLRRRTELTGMHGVGGWVEAHLALNAAGGRGDLIFWEAALALFFIQSSAKYWQPLSLRKYFPSYARQSWSY